MPYATVTASTCDPIPCRSTTTASSSDSDKPSSRPAATKADRLPTAALASSTAVVTDGAGGNSRIELMSAAERLTAAVHTLSA